MIKGIVNGTTEVQYREEQGLVNREGFSMTGKGKFVGGSHKTESLSALAVQGGFRLSLGYYNK